MKKLFALLIAVVMVIGMLAGCGSSTEATTPATESASATQPPVKETPAEDGETIVIRYSMWDSAQQPAYETICENFEKENPGVDVQIELIPHADYWTKLTTQASGGSCPDVMTMMVDNFPTLQKKGILEDLTSYMKASGLDLSKFNSMVLDRTTVDGKIYGVPKDFDVVTMFYNEELLAAAGYDSYPADLSWNAEDGGSYIKFLQDLTLDANGLHPYDAGFDPANIVQYGLLPVDKANYSADSWANSLIESNGGKLLDPDTGAFTLSSEKSTEALAFLWKMTNEWYVTPPQSMIASTGAEALFYAGMAATWHNGPWITSSIATNATFDFGIALDPVAESTGKLVSRANSLFDCVYSGSKHKDIAYKFVEYVATVGQEVLGSTGTVIPANADYSKSYLDYFAAQGHDVQIFFDAYNGAVAMVPSVMEFSRANDIFKRQMALALDGTGTYSYQEMIATIESEANEILIEANK